MIKPVLRLFASSRAARGILLLLFLAGATLTEFAFGAMAETPTQNPNQQLEKIMKKPLYQRWKRRQAEAAMPRYKKWKLGESIRKSLQNIKNSLGQMFDTFIKKWRPNFRKNRTNPWKTGGSDSLISLLKGLAWIVLGALTFFLLILLIRYFRGREFRGDSARILSREQVRDALEAGEALALDSPEWLNEAERLVQAQDFRAVYRALYLALLSGLHKIEKIDFRKNRTNWRYVSHYRGEKNEVDDFTYLTTLFDEVWYGLRPATDTSLGDLKDRVNALLRMREEVPDA